MSVSRVDTQRRFELRATQVEVGISRSRAEVRALQDGRAKATSFYAEVKAQFDAVRRKLLRAPQRSQLPEQGLAKAVEELRALRRQKSVLQSSGEAVVSLGTQHAESVRGLRAKIDLNDTLQQKIRSIEQASRRTSEQGEFESQLECRLGQACRDPGGLSPSFTHLGRAGEGEQRGPVIMPLPVMMPVSLSGAKEVAPSTSAGESARPSDFSRGVSALQTSDSQARSTVSLEFQNASGERIALELVRKSAQSLEVKVTAQQGGDRRLLWKTREEITQRLKKAGYSVERFSIGGSR
ncbi:MAG: hypothetical protein J0M12_02640 [Deltaproteobacteria bacterium]|nr:hypothetical protein [Deltaproteobacteria bacterium]